MEDIGRTARQHPDTLVYEALRNGFDSPCYDWKDFFDTDHPVVDETGATVSVPTVQAGSGAPWFLMDCSRSFKAFIVQTRTSYDVQSLNLDNDETVFMRDASVCGVCLWRPRSRRGGLRPLATRIRLKG